jgi:uncharacterized alkaline shock family protein YloU
MDMADEMKDNTEIEEEEADVEEKAESEVKAAEDGAKETAEETAKVEKDMDRKTEGCGAETEKIGTIRIADEVVAMIAVYAAREVDGVSSMAGSQTREFLDRVGMKSETKGVKVTLDDRNVKVDLSINMGYGFNIPATSSKVQARVKQAIENMTGLNVTDVNVRIAGIAIPAENGTKEN